ncbi:MAG: orotate phosphoribosyltransferase [Bacteroidia bacterium]|nr:orotate phosphoribosyltransferase [Bacteroidia bacterium]NNK73054.1 orotate phosphoribosyltransferase [Flavobacteriaceae bacterium]
MIINDNIAHKTAELLLQINAIKLSPDKPFTWASGWKSPIYCDNRVVLSHPAVRNYVREQMVNHIEAHYGRPDCIAGVATGAIGIGALVADRMNLPFVYVRPEPKKHGRQNKIEGHAEKGSQVIVIEDLISTGRSSLKAVNTLRESELKVKGMLAIFSYEFETAHKNFETSAVELFTLSNYPELLNQAVQTKYISAKELETLKAWNDNPSEWNPL